MASVRIGLSIVVLVGAMLLPFLLAGGEQDFSSHVFAMIRS